MFIIIDNEDSFTYTLKYYISNANCEVMVVRPSEFKDELIEQYNIKGMIISPGPKHPSDAKLTIAIFKKYYQTLPVLGICLGHQIICQFFNHEITQLAIPAHGKLETISFEKNRGLMFNAINEIQIDVVKYHSLYAKQHSNSQLYVTAKDLKTGIIMAIEHKTLPIFGIQFHPEAHETNYGQVMINNFLSFCIETSQDEN